MHRSAFLLACLVSACPPSGGAFAAEGNSNCTGFINTLPAALSTQGVWCLAAHQSASLASGAAIIVNGNNITIDCNGFAIRNTSLGATTADGVLGVSRRNVTVRNCDIHGFEVGIHLPDPDTGGHLVEDNQVQASKQTGIAVEGDASIVRRNRVLLVGGGAAAATKALNGIGTRGAVDIGDNMVSGMVPGDGGAIGIHAWESSSARISGNNVRDLRRNASTGPIYGIYAQDSGPVAITGNTVAAPSHQGGIGLACDAAHVRDNVVVGYVTGQFGCEDHGGNVYAP